MSEHPITPSDELVQEWTEEHRAIVDGSMYVEDYVAAQTARYRQIADAELEACCADIHVVYGQQRADWLREMRRPKPPSLAEQALEAHESCTFGKPGDRATIYAACQAEGGTADDITLRGLRAVLDRWGSPAPEMVAVTEESWDALVNRLWGNYETIGHQGERFMYEADFCTALDIARQEIDRWVNPAPAPPADGEVAELVSKLQTLCADLDYDDRGDDAGCCYRAAELLQRQALVPLPEVNK